MPSITFTLTHPLNQAIQQGTTDVAYYADTSTYTFSDSSTVDYADAFVRLGVITAVNYATKQITCDVASNTVLPASNDFLFFSKDNRANMTSLLGYYAEVEVKNNSTDKAELFAMGSEIFESSK
tara:strand:+ start:552 stop:923 length:372 start_codon:yes stop_codon:yes gene_type:complete